MIDYKWNNIIAITGGFKSNDIGISIIQNNVAIHIFSKDVAERLINAIKEKIEEKQ